MAKSLRIYASFIRSGLNFYQMQMLRDRNAERFAQVSPTPAKEASWTGDTDIIPMNEQMRDELDNTQELIALLEDGGMDLVCHSEDASEEDIFLLGPDLIDQLKYKCKIMRRHWLDIQDYLAPPHK